MLDKLYYFQQSGDINPHAVSITNNQEIKITTRMQNWEYIELFQGFIEQTVLFIYDSYNNLISTSGKSLHAVLCIHHGQHSKIVHHIFIGQVDAIELPEGETFTYMAGGELMINPQSMSDRILDLCRRFGYIN